MVFPSHLNQTLVEFLTNWHILKSRISMERNKIFENSIFHLEETICIYLKKLRLNRCNFTMVRIEQIKGIRKSLS